MKDWINWTFVIASKDDISSEEELLRRYNDNDLDNVNFSAFRLTGPEELKEVISFGEAFAEYWCIDGAVWTFIER